MRRIGALVAAIGLLILGSGAGVFAATDDGSKLTITSPAPGAKVGKDIELAYELTKGTQATHAHCFVDGEYQKGWDKKTVKGMSPGTHEIKVVAADKDHQMLAAEAIVKVDVQ
ncbi:MAG: hypothetical protein E8D40_05505 [Nitrospira sp.]|nr:MAG: hypothetical protein E8D40_05505 [Nitrospira sp.]